MADTTRKFLDLEGLNIFWKEINRKKQNRDFEVNGETVNLENYITQSKQEINKLNDDYASLYDTTIEMQEMLNYETGVFGGEGEIVWWTNKPENQASLKYQPYEIKNGEYEKLCSYCTITAQVPKVEGWLNIYISPPFTPTATATNIVVGADSYRYIVSTDYQTTSDGQQHSVIKITREDGQLMTRSAADGPTEYIDIVLKYKC